MTPHPLLFRLLCDLYPPYLFTGVRVTRVARDYSFLRVEMPLRFYNRNAVGTHFGGSLYAMVDPWLMFLHMYRLGPKFHVWDQAADITFLTPGRGRLHAEFVLPDGQVEALRQDAAAGLKVLPRYEVLVRAQDGNPIARVWKTLYVRLKREFRPVDATGSW